MEKGREKDKRLTGRIRNRELIGGNAFVNGMGKEVNKCRAAKGCT